MQMTKIHFEDKILSFQLRLRGWDIALGVFHVFLLFIKLLVLKTPQDSPIYLKINK